ncbi:MAG: pantetheine-phosphate adenylyltransferase [bacterium]|nr:pantetheine-phosphate adenylyltransferase [bacterium]
MLRRAVYPGSFDPLTNGHLDIIHRAAEIVDELLVAVVCNPSKSPLFSLEERRQMLSECLRGLPNVRVDCFEGLLVDYMRVQQAGIIVKGLRAVSDFEVEFQMALMNRKLAPEVDTIFLMTSAKHAFLSSSSVKEVVKLGGQVSDMVPPYVEERLLKKFFSR